MSRAAQKSPFRPSLVKQLRKAKMKERETRRKVPPDLQTPPTSPVASETASPFRKGNSSLKAGPAGAKTSFRKPREEELEASEKKKEQEPEKAEENEKMEEPCEQPPAQEAPKSTQDARLSAEYEKVELPLKTKCRHLLKKPAPLATEVFE